MDLYAECDVVTQYDYRAELTNASKAFKITKSSVNS